MDTEKEHELEVVAAKIRLLLIEASAVLECSEVYGGIVLRSEDHEVLL